MSACGCSVNVQASGNRGGWVATVRYCPLHAAAPDLLAALERIANPPQDKPGPLREMLSQPYEDCREIARAAIAKATGTEVKQ